MKNILIILCIISLSHPYLFAQNKNHSIESLDKENVVIEGGIKGDVNFLNFQKTDAPGAVSVLTPGGTIGCLMNVWFKDWIGIQPELNLNVKQTILSWESNSGKMQSFGVEVPIYIIGRIKVFGSHHIQVGLGPYTEFSCYAS